MIDKKIPVKEKARLVFPTVFDSASLSPGHESEPGWRTASQKCELKMDLAISLLVNINISLSFPFPALSLQCG